MGAFMIGEREDILNENQYGDLTMRPYVIDGNEINAFYDDDDLVCVLDNTINQTKPNVLLVINPSGDKKWDEILSGQYNVDLETIRPKQDNKYQKLDIEYSGLSVYENLINAYVAGDDLSEHMIQLNILRDSAARHSAMTRLNVANEIIAKTNMTIVKTKESIVRLQNRIKTLRAKLSATKKEIGKVSTKQSAAKILKIESQIEAANEKLKRARKRLESAQKRLETATVDAELASDLLNQPATEIPSIEKNKPVMVAPKYELQAAENESVDDTDDEDFEDDEDSDYDESKNEDENKYDDDEDEDENTDSNDEIKPLFDENPNNMNEEIAFKPINFDTPIVSTINTNEEQSVPVFTPTQITENTEEANSEDFDAPNIAGLDEPKPVLESMAPVNSDNSRPVLESITPIAPEQPIESMYSEQTTETQSVDIKPEMQENPVVSSTPVLTGGDVPSVVNTFNANVTTATSRSRPTFIYYMLLIILIVLSVFTLWLYQKHMDTTEPLLTPDVVETIATTSQTKPVERLNIKKATKEIKNNVVKVAEPESEEYEFVDDEDVTDTKSPVAEEAKDTNVDNEPATEPEQTIAEESVTEDETPESKPEPETEVVESEMDKTESLSDTEEQSAEVIADEDMDADVVSVDKPVYEVGPKHDDMIVSEQDYQANVQDTPEPEDETEEYYEE